MTDRQGFLTLVKARLERCRAGLDRLRIMAIQSTEDMRMKHHAQVAELQSRLAALQTGVVELERVPEDSWRKLQFSLEQASQDLDHSLAEALPQNER